MKLSFTQKSIFHEFSGNDCEYFEIRKFVTWIDVVYKFNILKFVV